MSLKVLGRSIRLTGCAAVIATIGFISPNPAFAEITAFKQAVAEAAADGRDIAAFYRSNTFQPIWTGSGEDDKARRAALFSAMETVKMHGLPAERHDTAKLMRALKDIRSPRDRGFAEVAMTKAYIQLARDMQSGVLEPSEVDDGIKRNGVYSDATTYLTGITENRPRAYFRSIVPQTREYARLMKEKIRLEKLIQADGWGPTVPAGSLEMGQSGVAVVALRDRLIAMGYLERSSTMTYDRNIEKAVQLFQAAHGLDADGQAGQGTMTEINTSPEARLRSVIVAMERERWLNKERGRRHILVNLTDFSARIMEDDRIYFETRSVVGANSHDRRTPEFSDVMEHMIINPRWNVPRSIAVNEYLPQMQRNRGAAGHLKLFDWQGREVSRSSINFGAYNARTFPYDMKQMPGKGNALGLVKYMFPNKYNIYLHDTPSKHLFAHERRAYSHGCIRLSQPFDFGYALLAWQEDQPREFFDGILNTGERTQVDLKEEIPVHIIYRTAFTDSKGRAQYRRDVYGRDAKIWNALVRAGVRSDALGDDNLLVAATGGDPAQAGGTRRVAARAQTAAQPRRTAQPQQAAYQRQATPQRKQRRARSSSGADR